MKKELTIERVRELFIYDSDTGCVTYRVRRGRIRAGTPAGSLKVTGYVEVHVDGHMVRRARLAWALMHGRWPEHVIDHINHNRSDDRITNLRDVTHTENQRNQSGVRRNNTSGCVGVSFHKKKRRYAATIYVNGKSVFLGEFRDLESAIAARKRGKEIHHGTPCA